LTTLENNEGIRIEPTTKTKLFAWIGVGLFIAFLIVLTSPTGVLLGESKWTLAITLHGMLSIFGALTVSVAAYLGLKLYLGQLKAEGDLRVFSILSVLASAAT